jgi:hypothetical protein
MAQTDNLGPDLTSDRPVQVSETAVQEHSQMPMEADAHGIGISTHSPPLEFPLKMTLKVSLSDPLQETSNHGIPHMSLIVVFKRVLPVTQSQTSLLQQLCWIKQETLLPEPLLLMSQPNTLPLSKNLTLEQPEHMNLLLHVMLQLVMMAAVISSQTATKVKKSTSSMLVPPRLLLPPVSTHGPPQLQQLSPKFNPSLKI